MNVVALVQARMGSTRLPGKALVDICGEPMLARVMARSGRAKRLDRVVVATTTEPADDVLVELCRQRGWPCFRGSENDVLDRYYRASVQFQADVVVRITSDCPLIDPELIDLCIEEFLRRQPACDFVSNTRPPLPFPCGLDVEVLHARTLEQAWREAATPADREHVTLYVDQNRQQRFNVAAMPADRDYSDVRLTVDTAEDLELAVKIYEHFGHDRFHWREVIELLDARPDWRSINAHVKQKQV